MPVLVDVIDYDKEILILNQEDRIVKIDLEDDDGYIKIKIEIYIAHKETNIIFVVNKKRTFKKQIEGLILEWLEYIESGQYYAGISFDTLKIFQDREDIKKIF